jgi:capsular polysaccharide biosynthesis protein
MMKRHGARLRETALLQSREVVVQPTDHILRCKELFLLRPSAIAAHWMPGVVARIPVESIPGAFPKHIYCRREPKSSTGRLAENALELEELFRSAGFTAIDPAEMSFGQQKAIFQQAEVIAGINGAAFANAIFRHDLPLSIGALMSANWISSLFPMVAKIFGFQYSGFVVPAVEDRIGASVLAPPETVHRLIERVLDRASRA